MNLLSFITQIELAKCNSSINGEIKIIQRSGKLTLLANDAEQSGGTITEMWENAIEKITNYLPRRQAGKLPARNATHSVAGGQITNCLILGLGGGTVIKILNKYYPVISIDAVEIDSMIIDIAKEYFDIKPSSKLEIIHTDAFSFIKTTKKKYDLVIFDLFLGKFNPENARTVDFLKDLKNLLTRSGFILFNAHFQNDEVEYTKLFKDCKEVFAQVENMLNRRYSRILFLGN